MARTPSDKNSLGFTLSFTKTATSQLVANQMMVHWVKELNQPVRFKQVDDTTSKLTVLEGSKLEVIRKLSATNNGKSRSAHLPDAFRLENNADYNMVKVDEDWYELQLYTGSGKPEFRVRVVQQQKPVVTMTATNPVESQNTENVVANEHAASNNVETGLENTQTNVPEELTA